LAQIKYDKLINPLNYEEVIRMCESSVYNTDGTKIMEDVISIKIDGDNIDLADILNQRKQLKGHIVEIDLDKHSIYIELA